jgi:hypothetical protein
MSLSPRSPRTQTRSYSPIQTRYSPSSSNGVYSTSPRGSRIRNGTFTASEAKYDRLATPPHDRLYKSPDHQVPQTKVNYIDLAGEFGAPSSMEGNYRVYKDLDTVFIKDVVYHTDVQFININHIVLDNISATHDPKKFEFNQCKSVTVNGGEIYDLQVYRSDVRLNGLNYLDNIEAMDKSKVKVTDCYVSQSIDLHHSSCVEIDGESIGEEVDVNVDGKDSELKICGRLTRHTLNILNK